MQLEIIVFAWESDGKYFFFEKLNSEQLMNHKVKILDNFFYSLSMKDVAGPESVQLRF